MTDLAGGGGRSPIRFAGKTQAALDILFKLDAGAVDAAVAPKLIERRAAPRVKPFSMGERSMTLAIALVLGMAVVAVGWCWNVGATVVGATLINVVLASLLAVAVIFASCSARQRLTSRSIIGHETPGGLAHPGLSSGVVYRETERLQLLAMGGLLLLLLGIVATVLAHLAFGHSDGSDLRDARVVAIDSLLRFDWTAYITRLNRHPAFGHMLITANFIAPAVIAATVLVLGLANRRRDLAEFLCTISLATASALALLVLMPTAGAYVHLTPDASLFVNLNPEAGQAMTAMLDAWHGTAQPGVAADTAADIAKVTKGRLVDPLAVHVALAVPGLLATIAVLVVYAVRRLTWIGVPVAALSVLMMLSTLNEGGQYLSQLLAGGMLATGCILFTKILRFKRVKKAPVVVAIVDREADLLTWTKTERPR
jgi:PAP2 superfamily